MHTEDKQVEVDLNEIRDCSLGEEGLTFVWLKMLAIFGNITVKADCHRCLVADNLKPIHDCLLKVLGLSVTFCFINNFLVLLF